MASRGLVTVNLIFNPSPCLTGTTFNQATTFTMNNPLLAIQVSQLILVRFELTAQSQYWAVRDYLSPVSCGPFATLPMKAVS